MAGKTSKDFDIKVGSAISLEELERKKRIEAELEELAGKDPRSLILRLAQLGRMDDARGQLAKLESRFQQEYSKLKDQLEKLQQPPLRDGVYLKPSPDDPEHSAIVGIGGSRMEVFLAAKPPVPAADLPGCEVWVNGENQLVKFRAAYVRGEAAEVIEVLDKTRLRVKARGNDEIIIERLPKLVDQTVESGDTVRMHPGLGVAFEKLAEKEQKALEPERIPDVQYDQIGGLDAQIAEIREAIESPFLYRHFYAEYGLKRPKGIFLYGPPGCGKTMVAKAIANSLSQEIRQRLKWSVEALDLYCATEGDDWRRVAKYLDWRKKLRAVDQVDLPADPNLGWRECRNGLETYLIAQKIDLHGAESALERLRKADLEEARGYFLSISGPELLNKYVGETEYSIRRIFMLARKKATPDTPVVIFFDELESMFSRRGSGISSDIESTIVPQLLSEIDGMDELSDVMIIGASNRYDLVDPAVLRPGRLDLKLFVGRPKPNAARSILRKYLLPNLPFDPETLTEFDGSAARTAEGLIARAVDVIYSATSYLRIYEKADRAETMNRLHRTPLQKRKLVSEIISGAMLESIVTRAKRSAVRRQIENGQHGLRWQPDLFQAIRSECEENKDQYVGEIRPSRDIAESESFAVEVHLDETPGASSSQASTKWLRGKTRGWKPPAGLPASTEFRGS